MNVRHATVKKCDFALRNDDDDEEFSNETEMNRKWKFID